MQVGGRIGAAGEEQIAGQENDGRGLAATAEVVGRGQPALAEGGVEAAGGEVVSEQDVVALAHDGNVGARSEHCTAVVPAPPTSVTTPAEHPKPESSVPPGS